MFQTLVPIEAILAGDISYEATGYLPQDNLPISPFVLCSAMNYGAVKIIPDKAISSPAEVELTELDEAIRWVQDRGTVRLLGRGTVRLLR